MANNTARSIMTDDLKAEYEAKYGTDAKKLRKEAKTAEKVEAIITNTKLSAIPTGYSAEALDAINACMTTGTDMSHTGYIEELTTAYSAVLELSASHDPGDATADRKCGFLTADFIGGIVWKLTEGLRKTEDKIAEQRQYIETLDDQYLANQSEVILNKLDRAEQWLDMQQLQADWQRNHIAAFQAVHTRFVGKAWVPFVSKANPEKDAMLARIAARKAQRKPEMPYVDEDGIMRQYDLESGKDKKIIL